MPRRRLRNENPWMKKALPVLVERLLDVTILGLNLLWKDLDDVGRKAILSGFLKVKSLQMIDSKFETLEQMNRLIASFPSLVHLNCSSSSWEENCPLLTIKMKLFKSRIKK